MEQFIRQAQDPAGGAEILPDDLPPADRYAAVLDLLPSLVAQEARQLAEPRRERALDAYARVRELTALAPRLSLDPAATVFQLGGILASVAEPRVS